MKTFARNLMQLAPDWVTLPPELVETFDWLEDQGWLGIHDAGRPEDHWLSIYPPEQRDQLGASQVIFGGTTMKDTGHWSTSETDVADRIFEIATTAGDGGRAAIWRDGDGHQQFVHLGHDTTGIISDDPLVFLQFLAMGYIEPGSLERTDLTPLEGFFEYHGVDRMQDVAPEKRHIVPTAFQAFLKKRFNLDMPNTARAIGINDFHYYQDPDTSDPFNRWLTSVTPPATQAELDYIDALMRTVEDLNLRDDDSSDTLMQKIGSLFKSKDKNQ